jgi:hypothetical protein
MSDDVHLQAMFDFFSAAEVDNTDSAQVRKWCTVLAGLCEMMRERRCAWDDAYQTYLVARLHSVDLDASIADRVKENLEAMDQTALLDTAEYVFRHCEATVDDRPVADVDALQRVYEQVALTTQGVYDYRGAAGALTEDELSPQDLAERKNGHYHLFRDGDDQVYKVWVEEVGKFLTQEEWVRHAATQRIMAAWQAAEATMRAEGRGPQFDALTDEQRKDATMRFIHQVASGSPA